MSEERARLQRQIEQLEARLNDQEAIVKAVDNRVSLLGRIPQVRVGKTAKVSSSYPSEDSKATAFGVVFQDPTFFEDEGEEPLLGPFLSDTWQRIGLTIPPTYIPEGTPVLVVEFDGKHYIIGSAAAKSKPIPEDDKPCDICTFIDELLRLEIISESDAAELKEKCECETEPASVECAHCIDGFMPATMDVTINGATNATSFNASLINAAIVADGEYASAADWFNRTHEIEMSGCTGLRRSKQFEHPVIGPFASYILEVRLAHTADGWVVTLAAGERGAATQFFQISGTVDIPMIEPFTMQSGWCRGSITKNGPGIFSDVFTHPNGKVINEAAVDPIHIEPNQDAFAPPPEHPRTKKYSCSSVSGSEMSPITLSIEGLQDTATEPQYNGWARDINGTWEMSHRDGGANGYAKPCEPAIWVEVCENTLNDPVIPKGPVVVIFRPGGDGKTLSLEFLHNTAVNDTKLVLFQNPANPFPVGADNKPLANSKYNDWIVASSDDSDLTSWLSNGTFTLNSF